jgi:predicted nucleotidyltransferase/DNA-binding XRE family transcriptional regulator
MDTAALVREARSRAGLTQAQFAQQAGTSQPTIAAYEAGTKVPSVGTLERLMLAAGLRLEVTMLPTSATGALLDVLRSNRDQIGAAAQKHGMDNVRVFGSVARRQDTDTSDIDLLVDFDVESAGLFPLIGFAQDVREITGREVDVATLSLLRDDLRAHVEAEALPI